MQPDRDCRRAYFTQKRDNLIVQDVIVATIDDEAKILTLEFPYPFQIFGLARVEDWTTNPPASETPMPEDWILLSTANNNANSYWLQQMFSIMMYANRDYNAAGDYSTSPFLGAITYTEKQWGKFNNYFWNYLNPALKPLYYNAFLAAPSWIKRFWVEEDTIADPYQLTQRDARIMSLMDRLFNQTDRRVWGAPGLYTVNYGAGTPSGAGELYVTNTFVVSS